MKSKEYDADRSTTCPWRRFSAPCGSMDAVVARRFEIVYRDCSSFSQCSVPPILSGAWHRVSLRPKAGSLIIEPSTSRPHPFRAQKASQLLNAGPHGGQKHLEQLEPNPLKSTLPSTCSTWASCLHNLRILAHLTPRPSTFHSQLSPLSAAAAAPRKRPQARSKGLRNFFIPVVEPL